MAPEIAGVVTPCVKAAEVELMNALLPAKTAVMECVPAARDEVLKVAVDAVPVDAASVPVPSVVEPSIKVTVPVGGRLPCVAVTVAVNLMLELRLALAVVLAMVVVVVAPATFTTTV